MQTTPLHLCSIFCSLLTRTRTLEEKNKQEQKLAVKLTALLEKQATCDAFCCRKNVCLSSFIDKTRLLHFTSESPHDTDTLAIQTLRHVPLVSVLTRFHFPLIVVEIERKESLRSRLQSNADLCRLMASLWRIERLL